MLFGLFIITRHGVVLWKKQYEGMHIDPVNALIKNVLMEEKSGEPRATVDNYNFSWKFSNHLGLIYIVCFQGVMRSSVLEEILDGLSVSFEAKFAKKRHSVQKLIGTKISFDETAEKIVEISLGGQKSISSPEFDSNNQESESALPENSVSTENLMLSGSRNRRQGPRPFQKKTVAAKVAASNLDNPLNISTGSNAQSKTARDWSEFGILTNKKKNLSEADIEKLNARGKENAETVDEEELRRKARILHGIEDLSQSQQDSDSEDDESLKSSHSGVLSSLYSVLPSFIRNRMGGVRLTDEELDSVLQGFEKNLMNKNVARDVAVQIAQSVKATLRGTTTEKFQSVHAAVRSALAEAVRKILTPKKSVDVLRMALASKSKGQVFSICFLGTNGVGKSTNLAKIAFYLQHKGGLKVLIAACDTFRAGAVEQLRTHARNLDCELFERGYGKDAAEIASEALSYAKKEGFDVVLIDTAGRMQDNEPLMRALGKLVSVNKPDLVLFVGEALVGNDAIDQLVKFNATLRDLCNPPRNVDGMVLSKFDTVDDKVGAALTMVATTGQPVVFVGTGQKYPHLRKLQVSQVVEALLS
eukprot:GDKJ01002180.1.p1 GENE.GDKJ01002180.1~~GDKJ01002180.1.p1  ORF type:complete len:587 (+),score=137.94 GDKJ01002180.1:46-1806(+)